jgi:hypothetical protein
MFGLVWFGEQHTYYVFNNVVYVFNAYLMKQMILRALKKEEEKKRYIFIF